MKKIFGRPRSLKPTPFHYCPGCGHSIVHRLVAEVIDEMDMRGSSIGVPPRDAPFWPTSTSMST
jgi:2-oxoglutarate ferredoxin oxidoreductase subunit beta